MKELKDITAAFFGEIVVGAVVVTLSIALAYAITGCISYAAITAPEYAKPGELVRVTSDTEADWIVAPEEYNRTSYIDSNKKTLVIANPKEGTVYLFAATADPETQEPKAYCWKLIITEQAPETDDKVDPAPTPKPVEIVFPQTVTNAIRDIDSPNKENEVKALLDVLKSTVGFIDNGSVTTPAGARETIRRNWTIRAAAISPETETIWAPVLIQVFKPLATNDVKNVKESLNTLIKALEGTNE